MTGNARDKVKNTIGILLIATSVCIGTNGARATAGPVVVDRLVAVVNDEIITMSDLQREMLKRADSADQRLVLEEMIDRKLQMSAAKRNGMDVSDHELDEAIADIMKRNSLDAKQFEQALAKEGLTLEQYRSEFREQMTLSRLYNKFVRTGVAMDEAEVRSYYDRNAAQFSLPEEVNIRHLVVTVPEKSSPDQIASAQEKAAALMARIRSGEDFVRLIREYSGGPTAAQDGDLGFLRRSHLIPEIGEAAKDLKPGEYAGPVACEDGFHIIRLEAVRTPVRPYEKVKDEITKLLYEQKMDNTYRAWLQTLRSDSHIENRL